MLQQFKATSLVSEHMKCSRIVRLMSGHRLVLVEWAASKLRQGRMIQLRGLFVENDVFHSATTCVAHIHVTIVPAFRIQHLVPLDANTVLVDLTSLGIPQLMPCLNQKLRTTSNKKSYRECLILLTGRHDAIKYKV